MLQRLINVLFYGAFGLAILLVIGGFLSFDLEIILSAIVIAGAGWAIRYIFTGEKYFDPKIQTPLSKAWASFTAYLKKLAGNLSQPDSWTEQPNHPWRRYFARMLDTMCHGLAAFFVFGFILALIYPETAENFFMIFATPSGRILDILLTIIFAMIVTAAVIGYTGSSLGKFLFGIKVLDENNNPLGYIGALKRELRIYTYGLGFGIPLVSLITLIMSYIYLHKNGRARWDKHTNHKILCRNNNGKQVLMNVIGFVAVLLVIALIKIV